MFVAVVGRRAELVPYSELREYSNSLHPLIPLAFGVSHNNSNRNVTLQRKSDIGIIEDSLSFFSQILFPVIYCTIVYFMTDQPNEGLRYTQFLSITILTCLVAQSIGLLIGTVAPSLPVSIGKSL